MYKYIIWDFDGTLFNTYPGMVDAFHTALKDYGVEEDIDNVFTQMKVSVGHAVRYFSEKYNLNDDFSTKYKEYEDSTHETVMRPFPYAREVCALFKKFGGTNYIFTHRDQATIRYLKYHDMLKYFDDVVTKEYGYVKPNADGFEHILKRYNLDKSLVLAVGDRDVDILGAQNAGIKACLFNIDGINVKANPDYIIKSLDELYSILLK